VSKKTAPPTDKQLRDRAWVIMNRNGVSPTQVSPIGLSMLGYRPTPRDRSEIGQDPTERPLVRWPRSMRLHERIALVRIARELRKR
jgi:hypothetical protein